MASLGHYNIQRDQFGAGRFLSVVPFGVLFGESGSFCGNELRPVDMHEEPTFHIGGQTDQLYTIVVTSLDSNPIEGTSELLHFAISNLSSGNKGDTWMDYMPPIPARGSGYHRLGKLHQKYIFEPFLQ